MDDLERMKLLASQTTHPMSRAIMEMIINDLEKSKNDGNNTK